MHKKENRLKYLVALALLLPALSFAQAANISVTTASQSGVNLAGAVNASPTTYFPNDGYTFLYVKNSGGAVTATIISPQTSMSKSGFGSVALSNITASIPSNTILGPYPTQRFNSNVGTVGVSFTSVTNVSVTAIRDFVDGR